jgi:hypothetical protein
VADAAPVRTQVRVARAGKIGYGRSRSLVQDGPPPRPPCRAVLPKIGCRPTSVKGHKSSSSSLMSAVSRPFSGTVTPPLRAYFGAKPGPADPSEKDGFRWSVSATAHAKAPPRPRFAQRGHNMATIRPQMKPSRLAIGRRLSQRTERRYRVTPRAPSERRNADKSLRSNTVTAAQRRLRRPPPGPGDAISLCETTLSDASRTDRGSRGRRPRTSTATLANGAHGRPPRRSRTIRRDARTASAPRLRDEEGEPELADLHLVTVAQLGRGHALAIDVRAVEAAGVDEGERGAAPTELRVRA